MIFKRKVKLQLTCPHCEHQNICTLQGDENRNFINALRGMRSHATKMHSYKYRKYPIIKVL
jgi:transcription elongation factor Elf1